MAGEKEVLVKRSQRVAYMDTATPEGPDEEKARYRIECRLIYRQEV